MEQTSTAENFTNETPVAGTEAPSPVTEPGSIETPPEQIEDEPADPGPVPEEPEPAAPEVEATVGRDLNSGKYLVSIVTRHPDPTVVSVNGKAVWEGVG
jgi:hypothetical protein